ncbi:hypothetical protein SAMN05216464_11320 [Mucilaginibacter pineti]|uniref:Uncharacterized protein n=1 Tax=Mucilaginibacter pineti TaxID=1391627 RepID=A0A1G7IGT8_9SPHI|nr:hypothetical protein [Mucilaginibacter pineti]SDF11746.1 hypothetical protein SAMN05216464_11320 [Mucilaginibacter pineti]
MTWTSFAVILLLCYLAYYGLNLLFDLVIHKPPAAEYAAHEELVFQESFPPQQIAYQAEEPLVSDAEAETPATAISSGPVHGTGAVGILQLLSLAKDDLIEYTKAIPY